MYRKYYVNFKLKSEGNTSHEIRGGDVEDSETDCFAIDSTRISI